MNHMIKSIIDGFGEKINDIFQTNLFKELISFVKVPIYILWLLIPLALYGYIQTQDMLLYWTFIGMMIFNICASIIAFIVLNRTIQNNINTFFHGIKIIVEQTKHSLMQLIDYTKAVFNEKSKK
jgi:hypothetical protein